MFKKLAVTIAAAAMLSTVAAAPVSAAPMKSHAQLAQLAQSIPDATAHIKGVPSTPTLVAEAYSEINGHCLVERTRVWSDNYGLFRHATLRSGC